MVEWQLNKKVSIAVFTYNQQEFVHETLDSFLAQTYQNIEIIVCDDGSSDETPNIIRRYASQYPDRIIPVLHPVNTGIAENVNRGIRAASGDYINLFGGDDIMLPDKIAVQVAYLEQHPELSGCYHDAEVFDWPSGEVRGLFSRIFGYTSFELIDAEKYLDAKCRVLPSTVMMRRAAIKSLTFDNRLKLTNDFLFYIELIINSGALGFVNGALVRYRKSAKSVCITESAQQYGLEDYLMALAILEARYPYFSNAIQKRTRHEIFRLAAAEIKFGNIRRFKDLCLLGMHRGSRIKGGLLWAFGSPIIAFLYRHKEKYAVTIKLLRRWVC